MRAKLILISICIVSTAVMAGAYISLAARPSPPTPPLLKHARSSGGWWSGGCPPHANDGTFTLPEARSPDVEQRLASQFPAGTTEKKLASALQEQGFNLIETCDNDPQIHRASFRQEGGALWGPYPVFALIAWKIDDVGNVVWTKALIAYTGP